MKTNSISLMLILLFATILLLPVYAQSSSNQTSSSTPITVMTNKLSYSDGDTITISGSVSDQLNVPISIVIKDPSKNIVLIGQVTPGPDNTFSTQVVSGGGLWSAAGTYEIDVTYGSKDRTAKTTFEFTGYRTYPIMIQGTSYNVTYTITNGSVLSILPNTDSKLLLISIDAKGNGTMVITLPRSLIDAKAGGQDDQFVVQEDGSVISAKEAKSVTSRMLTVSFDSNTKQIEIIGTQIIPEFGLLSFIILTASMVFVLFYAKRHNLMNNHHRAWG